MNTINTVWLYKKLLREDERVSYQLSGHKFEQTLKDTEEQGGLECYSPWGRKESDTAW